MYIIYIYMILIGFVLFLNVNRKHLVNHQHQKEKKYIHHLLIQAVILQYHLHHQQIHQLNLINHIVHLHCQQIHQLNLVNHIVHLHHLQI